MKFKDERPLTDPESAMRKLLELANAMEPEQGDRYHVGPVNAQFMRDGGTPEEYRTGL